MGPVVIRSETSRPPGGPGARRSTAHPEAEAPATVAPVETPAQVTRDDELLEPPYAVILYNDDVNTMQHVVESLMGCVPQLSHEEAAEIMLEAHQSGQARVTVAPHAEAARYRNCLESRGLTATIEPA